MAICLRIYIHYSYIVLHLISYLIDRRSVMAFSLCARLTREIGACHLV